MKNLVISWHPEKKERILLCCHYDTRPFPDQDRRNPRGRFIGANDGASGVALFMEMAHHIKTLELPLGLDMVLFDGEELVFKRGDKYFLDRNTSPHNTETTHPTINTSMACWSI